MSVVFMVCWLCLQVTILLLCFIVHFPSKRVCCLLPEESYSTQGPLPLPEGLFPPLEEHRFLLKEPCSPHVGPAPPSTEPVLPFLVLFLLSSGLVPPS